MSKLLTRRAREYYEVFDELYEDGYVPHEIWQTLSKEKQESQAKMTIRIVEDSLVEHGYSKGCSNEQKKYRTCWLQDRGLTDLENLNVDSAKSDPIVGAVEAFKKRIEKEAHEKADQSIQSMQTQLNKIKEEYSNLKQEHQVVLNERNLAIDDAKKLNYANKSLENDVVKFKKDCSNLESNLNKEKADHAESIKKEQEHRERLIKSKNDALDRLTESNNKHRDDYKQSVSELKEQSEQQRHAFIARIDALNTENQKLSKSLHKAEMSEQKANDQCQVLQKQLNQLKNTYNDLNKDFKQKTDLLLKSEKQAAKLESKAIELESIVADEKAEKQKIQEKLLEAQKELGKLTTENKHLNQQINKLESALKKSKK